MNFFAILSSILNGVSTVMRFGWKIAKAVGEWMSGADLRRNYKEDKEAVKDGNVDEINKIIRKGQS